MPEHYFDWSAVLLKSIRLRWNKFLSFFKPQYDVEEFYRDLPPEHADEARRYDEIVEHFSSPIQEGWDEIRKWTTRGLGGGLLASLTLLGSQALQQQEPISHFVRLLVVAFLVGLSLQLVRQFVLVYENVLHRRYALEYEDTAEMRVPAPYLRFTTTVLDSLAMLSLLMGVSGGLWFLLAPIVAS